MFTVENHTMQVKVQANPEFIKFPDKNDVHNLMVRYIHFGELNKYSLNKVYLEIANFIKEQHSEGEGTEIAVKGSKESLNRIETYNR